MNVVQAVAPTIEPITAAEAKMHLNTDSETFAGNVTSTQSIAPGSKIVADNYTTHAGTGVDILGKTALVYLEAGTNGADGTVDCKVQDSDDNVTYTDVTSGAFTQVTTANDNATYEKAYTGTKQYIRTVAKVLLAACEFGTSIVVDAATIADADLLTDLIQATRENVEDITRRKLLTQTYDMYLDQWPSGTAIKLPFGNLASVTHIKYTDSDSTETTMTAVTDYIVETNGEACGRIVLPYGETWPSFTAYTSNPIVIRFICGWTTAALIPSKIRTAVKMILADFWANRGDAFVGQTMVENKAADGLLASSKLWDEF